jgi:ribonuclease H / adenosylcobalamin/alpha-ribazole phosphatase
MAGSTRSLVVEADGGSRGNPGVAGYGAVVRDAQTGEVLVERAGPLGRRSNNVAEYRGLIAGLEAAVGLQPGADVEVRMDSKLVIEQMSGRWKIKHEDMQALAGEARALVAQLGTVTWRWMPREQNRTADRLSNVGMDGTRIDTLPTALSSRAGPSAVSEVAAQATAVGEVLALPGVIATRLLLVRHAVTDFTVSDRVDGRGGADPDLNAEGQRQAAAVAAAITPLVEGDVRLVTSSLARTKQTGAAIAATLRSSADVDPDWDEQSFGDWDGAVFADLAAQHSEELRRLWLDRDYRRPGGESMAEMEARVLQAYERAVAHTGTVVVVTSRKPILVVLGRVLDIPTERFWVLSTDPASLTGVELWPDGRTSVPFVNRTAHLP